MKIPRELTIQREKEVWLYRQKCWTQERIASQLKISQPAVAKILKRLSKRYSEQVIEDIDRVKTEQIYQLEHIADEAMQAWDRSKLAENTKMVKSPAVIDNGKVTPLSAGSQTTIVRDLDGDHRYLATAMKAKEDIRKILGADAPQKNEITGRAGKPIEHQHNVSIYIPENGRDADAGD